MNLQNALYLILLQLCSLYFTNGFLETPVTYEELQELNVTCSADNVCNGEILRASSTECNCEAHCVQLGTCCLQSRYLHVRRPESRPKCRSIGDNGIWMIDRCPQASRSKSAFADLCQEEPDIEYDLLRLVPVTSLYTHITYKNFFCFQCQESNEEHIFWNVNIKYDGETDVNTDDPNVHLNYDKYYKTWVAPVGKGGTLVPVHLDFVIPDSVFSIPKHCSPSTISECSENWSDDEIRAKCDSYMHLIVIYKNDRQLTYKNPHCAICNFENLEYAGCPEGKFVGYGAKKPFSFTYLLDINRSDGNKVGKIERCKNNDIWDPFFKKCRELKCAIPGYIVQEGKCVQSA